MPPVNRLYRPRVWLTVLLVFCGLVHVALAVYFCLHHAPRWPGRVFWLQMAGFWGLIALRALRVQVVLTPSNIGYLRPLKPRRRWLDRERIRRVDLANRGQDKLALTLHRPAQIAKVDVGVRSRGATERTCSRISSPCGRRLGNRPGSHKPIVGAVE